MSALTLQGVVKRYGAQVVVDGLDLAVATGEFVSLLGPSGCGKTTLLRMVAGLTACDGGRVLLGDVDVTRMPAHRRNVGVVFQSYALFPHLTVGENVAFGLKARGSPRAEIPERAAAALRSVRLEALADRPVNALSGGQQQRVAVARAIATRPRVLLLDEPLSALDRKLRETMQIELKTLLRDAGMTAIFVTHDQDEALVMSDRIAVMNHGRIEQCDVPEVVYARPGTEFTLNFVGLSAQWHGTVRATGRDHLVIDTDCGTIAAPATAGIEPGARVLVGVRPELLAVGAGEADDDERNRVTLVAGESVYRGANRLVYFEAPGNGTSSLMAELPGHAGSVPTRGSRLAVSWPVRDTLVFPLAPA